MNLTPSDQLALACLGFQSTEEIPRFRGVVFVAEGDDRQIVITTRTGGSNRDFFEVPDIEEDYYGPWNHDLQEKPEYRNDCDDEFDPSFAHFFFDLPPWFDAFISNPKSKENFEEVLTQLNARNGVIEAFNKWFKPASS